VIVFVLIIILGCVFKWDWIGFIVGYSKTTVTKSGNQTTVAIELPQGKTLWDWLQLLIVPAILGIGTIWFTKQQNKANDAANEQQHKTELQIISDNQKEAAFQEYINAMSELLLAKELRKSQGDDEVRAVARIRTLTVLRRLDRERKCHLSVKIDRFSEFLVQYKRI